MRPWLHTSIARAVTTAAPSQTDDQVGPAAVARSSPVSTRPVSSTGSDRVDDGDAGGRRGAGRSPATCLSRMGRWPSSPRTTEMTPLGLLDGRLSAAGRRAPASERVGREVGRRDPEAALAAAAAGDQHHEAGAAGSAATLRRSRSGNPALSLESGRRGRASAWGPGS